MTVAAIVQYLGAAAPTVLTYGGLLQYLSCPTTSAGPCNGNGACVEARDPPLPELNALLRKHRCHRPEALTPWLMHVRHAVLTQLPPQASTS